MTRSELDSALLDLRLEVLGGKSSDRDRLQQLYTQFWKRTDWLIAQSMGDDRIYAREALNDLLSMALDRGVFDLACADYQASPPVERAGWH